MSPWTQQKLPDSGAAWYSSVLDMHLVQDIHSILLSGVITYCKLQKTISPVVTMKKMSCIAPPKIQQCNDIATNYVRVYLTVTGFPARYTWLDQVPELEP